MKASNIVSAIHHLRMAEEHYEDFIREFPGSMGTRLFQSYITKIKWIYNDIISHPYITQEVRDGIKKEISSDIFAIPAINDKVALLNPEQREMIEDTIDAMLAGENVKIIDTKD
jgi:Fe-S cluster biosynthesis and repair protein YggX